MPTRTLNIDPQPDFARFERVLRNQGEPDRVPFYELFSKLQDQVLELIGWEGPVKGHPEDEHLQKLIAYNYRLGYDYVGVVAPEFQFPMDERPTVEDQYRIRTFHKADSSTIRTREDFDTYRWPDVATTDFSRYERVEKWLPNGMKVVSSGPGGPLENAMFLLGYEGISYLLNDDPDLVRDVFDAVGECVVSYVETTASFDSVGAVVVGDDMGFRTHTLLSPDVYREHLFPWYRKIVDAAHSHGKPIILHSCGNLTEVMDDIIDCGWDAKHSFEDAILPVWEMKEQYGDRISVLGGFDVDKICRMSEAEVRAHTRFLIDKCAPGGGWALGTGNSVTNYVPVDNFLAMIEEGFNAGRY